jgi:acetoin utilization deacetylase AcuC-like enzyme
MEAADRHCGGRVVSVLEGGYDLQGLAASAAAHVGALLNGAEPGYADTQGEDD